MPYSLTQTNTPGGGTAATSGIPGRGAVTAVKGATSTFHAGQKTADQWVQGFENDFGQKLAYISDLSKTDPERARQMLIDAWGQYLDDAGQFMEGDLGGYSTQGRVVKQSLSNPKLLDTIANVWAGTGGDGGLAGLNGYVSKNGSNQPKGNTWWVSLLDLGLPALAGLVLIPKQDPGKLPIPKTDPSLINPPPPMPVGGPPVPGTLPNERNPDGTPKSLPGVGPVNAGGTPPIPYPTRQSLFSNLWDSVIKPLLPSLINAGVNLYGANSVAGAANQAAQIQADASDRNIAYQRSVYNQDRSDSLPWLRTGTNAEYRLSDLMGLQPTPRLMPSTEGIPDPKATAPPANAAPPPNLDQLAGKYKIYPQQGASA